MPTNNNQIIQNVNYRTLTASLANDLVYRRAFGPIRYMNKELLAADIMVDLNDFIHNDGTRIFYSYINMVRMEDRNDYLKQCVKPLQIMIGGRLCILFNNYFGQDDGLFDMTATENYKSIQWDLVEFMIDFINLCAHTPY